MGHVNGTTRSRFPAAPRMSHKGLAYWDKSGRRWVYVHTPIAYTPGGGRAERGIGRNGPGMTYKETISMEPIPYIPGFAGSPLDTPRVRAMLARVFRNRQLAAAAREAVRAPRGPEPMDTEARARLERARRRTPPFFIRERNRLAKARERARRMSEDPEGYRRERREEMREWRASRLLK